jgi:peptidoglycan glycosyltransferase
MPSLESIMNLLNGSHGAAIFAGLRQVFLVCLGLVVAGLLLTPRPGRKQLWLLVFGLWLALLGLLAHQGAWQLAGFRQPEFVRFMRFHDPRPDAPHKQVRRGTIYDWRGTVLAETDERDLTRRLYPFGPACCHVVGYTHPRYGTAGIEHAADATLSGYSFANLAELDRFGRNLLDHRTAAGGDIRLTLDAELQRKAYALMADRKGAVVVLRPNDGAILCLLSTPGYDPRNPEEALQDTENAPLLNRAVQGLYPPGSTIKILVAGLAAERHLAPQFYCPGEGFQPEKGGRPIRDSEYYIYLREGRVWPGHGRIGLRYGFAHSSNVYFAQLGLALGADAFNGIMAASHIADRVVYFDGLIGALASEAGQVPRITHHDRRTLAQLAIGQGKMVVTPLHVAMWTATVAAGGELWRPRLRADAEPVSLGRVLMPEAAAEVKDLMREAVVRGTGRAVNMPGLQVCGKTGTAETSDGDDHAWFTCFAPRNRPEIVVTVLVEHGGYGALAAAPVARAMLEEAVALGLAGANSNEQEPAE